MQFVDDGLCDAFYDALIIDFLSIKDSTHIFMAKDPSSGNSIMDLSEVM